MQTRHLFLVALAAGSFLAAPARADRLDEELNRRMPQVVEQLKKYGTAGVLRFRVRDGAGQDGFAAPLSGRMVEKLEALLLIHNAEEEQDALKLVRDVGVVAGRNGIRSFSDPANREKLFRQRYPLLWGSGQATPDVFLTGKVELSPDRARTTVTLLAIDARRPRTMRPLAEFSFPTDRQVVRDFGLGFELSRQVRERLAFRRNAPPGSGDTRGVFDDLADKLIVDDVNKKQPPKGKDGAAPAAATKPPVAESAANVGGVAVEMLVNGEPTYITRSVAEGEQFQVTCPKPKDTLTFRLKNTTDKKLGVVLQVNGVNTLGEQKLPAEKAWKWVLPGKKEMEVKGYMIPEGKVEGPSGGKMKFKRKPFQVLVGAEEAKRGEEFGDKKGLIEVDVFEDVGGKDKDRADFSVRGLPATKALEARKSYQGLRSEVLKSNQLKTVVRRDPETGRLRRDLIVQAEKALPGGELQRRDLENPKIVAHLPIRVEPNDDLTKD